MSDYYGMISVDTAVVSDTGDLLIGLTDGNVINAGYVRGRPGPQGERGLMGPAGDPGRNGLDGAQLYTGLGRPSDDMGVEGDLYIDIRSRFLDIFQKTGGGWVAISSLRDPSQNQSGVPGMGGSHDRDGTGGGGLIINNDDDGPTIGNEGNPLQGGDLWYNPDTGHLHVRSENNLEWIPIAGLPSAEFSADPPTEDRGGHPIEEGDLWWDTDLAALFVAARDVTDQIVWVVALPADRGAVPDQQFPFRFPFSTDGRIETNPSTGIRYIYHAAKNQWIDIPTTGNNIFYQEDPPTFENVNLGVGDLWIRESDKQVYIFDGISWKEVRARPKVYTTGEPPVDASEGELYFDSGEEELTLYIRYNGDWVPAAPPVSTEGIESNLRLLNEAVQGLQATASSHTLQIADAQSTQYGLAQAAAVTAQNVQELQESQAVQDGQIIELEEEIESLVPSTDRGSWTFSDTMPLAAGEYTMGASVTSGYCIDQLERCMREAPGFPDNIDPAAQAECNRIAAECETARDNGELYMPDYSHAAILHFHKFDSEGKEHSFADWTVGKYIDLFDREDEDYALFEITEAPIQDGDIYTIGVQVLQHQGQAGGLVRVKVFEMASADPTNYVRKTGDEMTGKLRIDPPKNSGGLWVYAPQGDAGAGQADATQLVRVANSRNQYVFYVEESGAIAGKQGMLPTDDRHLVSKKYVDEAVAEALANTPPRPAQASWIYGGTTTLAPSAHYFHQSGNNYYLSLQSNNGLKITQKSIEKSWGPANASAFEMSFWLPKDSATNEWELIKHVELDKIYWEYKDSRDIYCLRFHKKWENNDASFYTQTEYYITVGGFF